MTGATIQTIFLLGYAAYQEKYLLPGHIRTAAWCLMNCRTAIMGGHIQACPKCDFMRNHYNSCKHRMCPLCAYIQVQKWLEKQKARILNCDHYHVIFTIPHELNFLWTMNARLLTNILFQCSRDTIFELLGDEKYLGAKPGIIASLHTWTKTLLLHPHIHCLVTGGGLKNGKWIAVTNGFLFPFAVARDLFRGKVIAALLKALKKGELILPAGMSHQKLKNLLNKLGRKKWNVRVCEKYSHGNGVLAYLARYLRGGPISNHRIIKIENGKVTFSCGRKKKEYMTLSLEEFIKRFLQHIPLPHSILVRSYGLYSPTKKNDLDLCREILGQGPVEDVKKIDWQSLLELHFGDKEAQLWQCPDCGTPLIRKPDLSLRDLPLYAGRPYLEKIPIAA